MPRGVKQFLYGILYLAIIVALGFGVYARFWNQAPSCFDGIQNGGEQGIDCGGPCAELCVASLTPVETLEQPTMVSNGFGRATIFAHVANANADAGVSGMTYSFSLLDASGAVVGSIPGETFFYPGQTKYLVAVNQAVPAMTASVALLVASTSWVASATMGIAPLLSFQNVMTAAVSSGTIAASGIVVNQDPVAVSNVLVVAFFKDTSGATVGISQTEIDRISGNTSANFSVLYPVNPNIDPTKTEVDAYGLRG